MYSAHSSFVVANAHDYFKEKRDRWIVGHFMPDCDIRHTQEVEIKWGVHTEGDCKDTPTLDPAYTFVVLIRGELEQCYYETPESPPEHITLHREGDFILSQPGVYHTWKALTDCLTMTVRWGLEKKA